MNNKGNLVKPLFCSLAAISVMICSLVLLSSAGAGVKILSAVLAAVAVIAVLLFLKALSDDVDGYLSHMAVKLGSTKSENQNVMPVPVVTVTVDGSIMWYNKEFLDELLDGCESHNVEISRIFKNITEEKLRHGESFTIKHDKRYYEISVVSDVSAAVSQFVLFFNNVTEKAKLEIEYENSRPAVILAVFDNEDELLKVRESERTAVLAAVDSLIREWVDGTTALCRSDARGTSLIVLDEQQLREFIQDRFNILNEARKIPVSGDHQVTLSIGVGRGGANLSECESWAQEALDMALGRGGDQAVIKNGPDYAFFGGVSKSSEKQSKVKTRMIAKDIENIISTSDKCFVMGHRFTDLDAVGASIGVMSIAKALGIESYVINHPGETLAQSLIDHYIEHTEGAERIFVDTEQALSRMTENSVVVVVDTHSKNFLDSMPVYENAKKVIVIDHHRMMLSRIENAGIFFHEPFASSASEMVAELAQYIDEKSISKTEAEALLAGIMLDTKSFVIKTGVRTFEAATFLRRRGADTVDVKMLFAGSLDDYAEKSKIVASAAVYRECAIACSDEQSENVRVVCAQAADEMLTLQGINASFVLFESEGIINISARSLGKLNVQLVMEKLGGGGHLTMAGAQLSGSSLDHALSALYEAIDTVFEDTEEDEDK